MIENSPTLAEFVKDWENYQNLLIGVLAPLTPQQLELRAAPHLRSIGMIATHMIGARSRWFHQFLGEHDPVTEEMDSWDRSWAPVRTASELVTGLQATWALMKSRLDRWTAEDMAQIFEEDEEPGEHFSAPRRWVIWHLIEHDLHHGGEISLTLGIHNLPAPDI